MQRIPLILAVLFIVVRIVLEENGVSPTITNILGVNWLYFLVPIYFALQIARSGSGSPYKALFKQVLIFGVVTRLMIMISYMLAYQFGWSAVRFSVAGGGGVGSESALDGMLITPLTGLLLGTVAALVIGMITGSITLAVKRKSGS